MARIYLTVNVSERLALECYKHLTRRLADMPEWERPDIDDVLEIMEYLFEMSEQAPDPTTHLRGDDDD